MLALSERFYGPPLPELELDTNHNQLRRILIAMASDPDEPTTNQDEAADVADPEERIRQLPEPLRRWACYHGVSVDAIDANEE